MQNKEKWEFAIVETGMRCSQQPRSSPESPRGVADHGLKTAATVSGVEAIYDVQGEGWSGHRWVLQQSPWTGHWVIGRANAQGRQKGNQRPGGAWVRDVLKQTSGMRVLRETQASLQKAFIGSVLEHSDPVVKWDF